MTAPAPASRARRLLRDTLHAASGRLASIALWIVVTPPVLRQLGEERFALWAVFLALTGYFGGLDLGLAQGTLRHVAAARTRGDDAASAAHTTLGVMGYLALGGLWWVLLRVAGPVLVRFLRVPPGLEADASAILGASALVFTVSGLANVVLAALQGRGRFDLANLALVASVAVQASLVAWSLATRGGLMALVGAVTAGWLVAALVGGAMLAACAPRGAWSTPAQALRFSRAALRFGLPMQWATVCATLHQHLDKFLLARLVALAAVTPYELGFRAAGAAATLPQQAMLVVMPMAAELDASGDRAALRRFYERGQRLLLAVTAVWGAAIVGSAHPVIRAWLGPGQEPAARALIGLALAWSVALTTGMGTSLARGIGRTDLESRFATVVLALHATLSLVLIPRFGLTGALVATVVANAGGATVFMFQLARALGWPAWRLAFAGRARPLLALALGAGAGVAIARVADGGLVGYWPAAAVSALAAAAIALGVLLASGAFRPAELRGMAR